MNDETTQPVPTETAAAEPVATPQMISPTPVPVDEHIDPVDAEPVPATKAQAQIPVVDAEGKPIPEDRPEDYMGYQQPTGPNPLVDADGPTFFQKDPNKRGKYDDVFFVSALPIGGEELNSLIDAYPSINYQNGRVTQEWAAEVAAGAKLIPHAGFLVERAMKEGSHWVQRVPRGAGAGLGLVSPNIAKMGGPGTQLSGDVAAMRAMSVMGLGEVRAFPLFHTGIWITMKAPTIAARLELNRRLGSEKVELGRKTDALAFSNASVYRKSYLADFAMAHIVTANTRYANALDLKAIILSTDLPLLMWGLLSTMYPEGYAYHQPCMHDPSKCTHVVKEYLDISKILFTDRTRLTEQQLARLEDRRGRLTEQQLTDYASQHYYVDSGLIELVGPNGSLKVQLKVPTIAEYASGGMAWVDGIVNNIQRAFGADLSGERRNDYILEGANVTDMCEYSHWVKSIGLPDGSEIVEEEVIRATLASLSGIPEISTEFFTKVKTFMENCTISMTALPKVDCPQCGHPMTADEQKHPYLNPIDIEALFFTMLDQQIAKALSA